MFTCFIKGCCYLFFLFLPIGNEAYAYPKMFLLHCFSEKIEKFVKNWGMMLTGSQIYGWASFKVSPFIILHTFRLSLELWNGE